MKKGFTLVEIIISISLIVLIGVGSTIGFLVLKKSNKEKTLENMSDEILTAVNVYVETNSDIKKALYESSKGLVIPLTTLENSGLLDFDGLTLTDDDYVITMLGTETEGADHCAETYIAKSWNIRDGETIYLCEKEQEGSTEEVYGSNLNKVTQQTYYYQGIDANNYIKLDNNDIIYRILYVENDDSIVLYSRDSFGGVFEDKNTMPLTSERFISIDIDSSSHNYKRISCTAGNPPSILETGTISNNNVDLGETYMDANDVINTIKCNGTIPQSWLPTESYETSASIGFYSVIEDTNCSLGYLYPSSGSYRNYYATCGNAFKSRGTPEDYKIRLKPCMKIADGVGTSADPYVLKNTCS